MNWFYLFLIIWVLSFYGCAGVLRYLKYKENIKRYELELKYKDRV